MNIIVCIKQVPGTTKVQVDETTGVLLRDGVLAKMNPFDLYAVETASRLKAQCAGGRVQALSMGPPQAEAVLREALMMGADEGCLLSDRRFAGADCLATSYALSQAIRCLGMPELIICGAQTTDGDTAQVGPELAEFLDIPHAANVSRITAIHTTGLVVEMNLPEQIQVVEIDFPGLICVEKGIYTPRLPSYRIKQATRTQTIRRLTLDDLPDTAPEHYGLNGSPTRVVRIFPPETQCESETWRGPADEVAGKLQELLLRKKVISANLEGVAS